MNTKTKSIHALIASTLVLTAALTGCYSVFSGGTSGRVADSESSTTPKAGIADVDVYAYTSEKDRDNDFNSWTDGTTFTPQAEYYGHTTTGTDGDFTLSKMVWKSVFPDFGKDADVAEVYLLFYHEKYGLTKGTTLIVSDSTGDTVYQELTAVRKTTALTLNFIDVATNSSAEQTVNVTVYVPQSSGEKKYETTVTGSGIVNVSYPRWKNGEINKPDVRIKYSQSADQVEWKGCKNASVNAEDTDYAFLPDDFEITKNISGDSYSVKLYGKKCMPSVPDFEGQLNTSGDALGTTADDGITITLQDESGTTTYGTTQTAAASVGTNGTLRHGTFTLNGTGTWTDDTYTGKTTSKTFKLIYSTGSKSTTCTYDTSMSSTITVQLK